MTESEETAEQTGAIAPSRGRVNNICPRCPPASGRLAARPQPRGRLLSFPPSLMTSLDDRYRLLKCVALGGGIRTHNAQETSTGRPVMVHILDGPEPDIVDRLRAQVGALPIARAEERGYARRQDLFAKLAALLQSSS